MPASGPLPKDPSQRRRRNADPVATTTLPAHGPDGPTPDLPGGHYDNRTLAWYDTWRNSPQAATFLATDWQRLHMLAEMVQLYWEEPRKDLLAEIRLNEAALGGTAADRIRMRWVVADSMEDSPASQRPGRTRGAARRDRVLKVVDGQADT